MRGYALAAALSAFALLALVSATTATPVGSASRNYIAFVHHPDEFYGIGEIWLVRPDGRDAHAVVPGELNYGPRWSPDGQTLVYDREPSIYATDATGQKTRTLFTAPCGGGVNAVHWSHGGKLAISACGDVYLKGPTGTRRLTHTGDSTRAGGVTIVGWTRDDKRLIVLYGRPFRVYTVGLSGGALKPMTFRGFPSGAFPAWSPDRKLAFFILARGFYVPLPLSGLNFDPSWQGGSTP